MATQVPCVNLNNGKKMPIIGLGTWQSSPEGVKNAVKVALDAGYRHIDTAYSYHNEKEIGETLQDYFASGKLRREDVFITTKLWCTHMKKENVAECFNESLRNLKLDYVDLYLIHAPISFKKPADFTLFPKNEEGHLDVDSVDILETWHALEDLVDGGKVKSIGLSNYNSEQIDRVCNGARIQPVVNQVECHAYFPQYELDKFCRQRGILLTAYSPIGSPGRIPSAILPDQPVLLDDPVVAKIASKYKKTPAQVLLRFLIQRSIIVIPKSITASRIEENFKVFDFELSSEDMDSLKSLARGERFFVFKAMKDHPEYPFNVPF